MSKFDTVNFLRIRIADARKDAERHPEGSPTRIALDRRVRRFEMYLARELWLPPRPFNDPDRDLGRDRTLN